MSKKNYYLFIFIFFFSVLSAQEKLSKEEKARREKNIQAGNAFAQFGYKAKIATLSKGKYLEFHDLDSIVTIGTVRWHVYKNEIVGRIVQDSLNPDAQPIGDRAGRWMSPDPLSEEFSSWSPYTMSFNNPIRFVDPDGRAADDWRNSKGQLVYDPKANGGKGDYTKHATAQEREFGDALRNSGATGTEQFNYLVSEKTQDIKVNFLDTDASSEGIGYLYGVTKNNYNVDNAGNVTEIKNSEINIFMGTADAFISDVKNNTLKVSATDNETKSDVKSVIEGKLTAKGLVTSTFGHELGHTTKANQQQSNDKAKNPSSYANSEYLPTKIEIQIKKDLTTN
ncbi:hypothetical protein [uncultured Flavobacterium sp.]|uniref:hypothetical protein n=1 Tax=uncultured Flavobacterium sp. TaxID=165435 RepID=UPI0025FA2A92|nr:hypothetical protein [uncultured Flavobacterium sp.]